MVKTIHIRMILPLVLWTTLLLIILHCDSLDPMDPGPQPDILDPVQHADMLNVFGVLRPDTLEGRPRSFVHLEFAYPVSEIPDSCVVTDAEIIVQKQIGEIWTDSIGFSYTDFDGITTAEYRNTSFFPMNGVYRLTCRKPGFPVLTAQTRMPDLPVIQDGSLSVRNSRLSLCLERDPWCGLIEMVLQKDGQTVRDRFLRPDSGDVKISLSFPPAFTGPCTLLIYQYDLNLSTYLTANLSIKPNIYQTDFSTVTDGYGCFGSLNVLRREIVL